MNNDLLILGAGGHGQVVKETAYAMHTFNKIDFLDDNSDKSIGKLSDYIKYINDYKYAFVAIGNNEIRMKYLKSLIEVGYTIPILIHPSVYASHSSRIGLGTILLPKSVIHTNVIIGKGCILSIGVLVDHDCIISDGVHLNTGAIVKASTKVEKNKKIKAGVIYSSNNILEGYCFEVGV